MFSHAFHQNKVCAASLVLAGVFEQKAQSDDLVHSCPHGGAPECRCQKRLAFPWSCTSSSKTATCFHGYGMASPLNVLSLARFLQSIQLFHLHTEERLRTSNYTLLSESVSRLVHSRCSLHILPEVLENFT